MPSPSAKKFLAKHKPLAPYRAFTPSDAKRLSKRAPAAMLAILEKTGWCAFDEQAIWLADPDEWEEIGRPWLPEESTACDVLLRSSFGDMVVWGGEFFWLVLPQSLTRVRQTANSDWLFGSTLQQANFHFNEAVPGDTLKARKAAGALEPSEVYAQPAAQTAGPKIIRQDAATALAALHRLGPIRSIDV